MSEFLKLFKGRSFQYMCQLDRGTAYRLYSLVIGVFFFASNITFGFLWDIYDIIVAVTYSVSLSLGAIIGMIVFYDYLLNQYYKI
jgi:hypothetical protein